MAKKKKKKQSDAEQYANVMGEVKARLFLADDFITKKLTTGSDTTDIEFIALQLRKVMELVALGSIVPNKTKYQKLRKDFEKHYHARRIMVDLEKVNPNFFPKAMLRVPVSAPGANLEIKKRENVWLSKKRFERQYDKLGKIMHADNPFAQRRAYASLYKQYRELIKNLWELMECHLITLVTGKLEWCVFMQERDKPVKVLTLDKEISE